MFIDIYARRAASATVAKGSIVKVVMPGGSGFIGTTLARAFAARGNEVVVLSRRPRRTVWRSIEWDGSTIGPWVTEIDGADVVVNLAGRSVNCRYNAANRREIVESRVRSTRAVGEAIARAVRPPSVWLQASTATIYAHRFDAPNDERTGMLGGNEADAPDTWKFSIDVARAWEAAFDEATTPATRKVALRSAMVMSPDPGGVLDMLRRLVRVGLGGRAGSGRQFVSWIHERDFVRAIDWLIAHESLSGVVNLAAPEPLPYAEFIRAVREAEGVPIGLPAPAWMLEIGAFVLRTETELVMKSRRVVPGKLAQSGFTFYFPSWPSAARELCARAAHAAGAAA